MTTYNQSPSGIRIFFGGMHSITFDILQDSLLGLKHAAVIMTVGDTGIISKKT